MVTVTRGWVGMQWPRLVVLEVVLWAFLAAYWATVLSSPPSRAYDVGSRMAVDLKVDKLTSARTQIPYGYYSLDFCWPSLILDFRENLGEMLLGDKIKNSPYQVTASETLRMLNVIRFIHWEISRVRSFAGRRTPPTVPN